MDDSKPPSSQKEFLKDVYESGRKEDAEVQFQILGRDLVNRFFMLYRTGKIHTLENEASQRAIDATLDVLTKLHELAERISLTVVGDTFYLNKTMLKADFSSFENFRFLGQLFGDYGFSGISFTGVPPKEEFEGFLSEFLGSPKDQNDKTWIGNRSFPSVQILTGRDVEEVAGKVVTRDNLADPAFLLRQYFKTVLVYRMVVQSFKTGDVSSLNVLQRLVHEYVDAMQLSIKSMLMLVNIHSTDDYVLVHSINVMILSLAMGNELGLSRKQMSDLGTAALLHDIGKTRISQNILDKTGKLLKHEWDQLQQANTFSVLQLLKLRGFNESSLCRLLVAHEHTKELDPEHKDRQPTLMARIVSIARCYDAMVTPRKYRSALLPSEALKLMKNQESTKFDPAILHLFINVLTEYPPGAILLLDTKEVGIVINRGAERSDPKKPAVRIIYDRKGKKVNGPEVDLGKDSTRKIVRSLDPAKFGINVIPFLFPKMSPPA